MNIQNTNKNTSSMQAHNKLKSGMSQGAVLREDLDLATFSDVIDYRNSVALNASSDGCTLSELMQANPSQPMFSDVDEQLLVKISFKGSCALTQLRFRAGEENAPRKVKVFVNKESMDFNDLEDLRPALETELVYDEKEAVVKLNGPNFSRVSSIQVLIEDNADDDEKTILARFGVVGHANWSPDK